MAIVTRGFRGRRTETDAPLPPGQYLTRDFPVLSAGPTPQIDTSTWELTLSVETGTARQWSWAEFLALPQEDVTRDIHCVTKWSKLGTTWAGVSVDTLLDGVQTSAPYAIVGCYGGYTTNLPVADLTGGKAWVVHRYDGVELESVHGGPARLLVPHLYFWKSAKWLRSIQLITQPDLGFWESLGYHEYGDPWREQRYAGD